MSRHILIPLLLIISSCSRNHNKVSYTATFYYFGSSNIYKHLPYYIQPKVNSKFIVFYSKSRQEECNQLIETLIGYDNEVKVKTYSLDEGLNTVFFDSQVVLLLEDNPSESVLSKLKELFQNNSFRNINIIGNGSTDKLFFGKISNTLNSYDTLNPKVGVDEVKILSGLNLVDLPILLVKANRLNRIPQMLSASLQNPTDFVISIDDSTLISIHKNVISVHGKGQAFMVKHPEATTKVENGLFGGENLRVSVFLPFDSIIIKQ